MVFGGWFLGKTTYQNQNHPQNWNVGGFWWVVTREDHIQKPEPPTKPKYVFGGWFLGKTTHRNQKRSVGVPAVFIEPSPTPPRRIRNHHHDTTLAPPQHASTYNGTPETRFKETRIGNAFLKERVWKPVSKHVFPNAWLNVFFKRVQKCLKDTFEKRVSKRRFRNTI